MPPDPDLLARAQEKVESMSLPELCGHHATLNGFDPIEAARRQAILEAVEEHHRAWIEAGRPRLPSDPTQETVETLRRRRRAA